MFIPSHALLYACQIKKYHSLHVVDINIGAGDDGLDDTFSIAALPRASRLEREKSIVEGETKKRTCSSMSRKIPRQKLTGAKLRASSRSCPGQREK
jgi:hypothetical protein